MATIERVELRLVDIPPKVKRTDAIQSFVSQETPIVSITDAEGAVGIGYSYTIGTGGSPGMRLLPHHLPPRPVGQGPRPHAAGRRGPGSAPPPTALWAPSAPALPAVD